jgi:hypothetical protein
MTAPRAEQLAAVSALLDGRPVRWSVQQPGDYDGRERTLEVFNADAKEQRDLLRRLRPMRAALETTAGGPVVWVFHTRTESARLYSDFVENALRTEVRKDVEIAEVIAIDDSPPLATDVGVQRGDRSLPRRAA